MTSYQVYGRAGIYVLHECDCEHCDQNGELIKSHTAFIDKTVEAKTPEEAQEIVARTVGNKVEWDEVEIVDLSKETRIRSRKEEMDLLERWNKGLGLPSAR